MSAKQKLQAWGCKTVPDARSSATRLCLQASASSAQPKSKLDVCPFYVEQAEPARGLSQSGLKPTRSLQGNGQLTPQQEPGIRPIFRHASLGSSHSRSQGLQPSSSPSSQGLGPRGMPGGWHQGKREMPGFAQSNEAAHIPLSAVGAIQSSVPGTAADPQTLAESWVDDPQQYGAAAGQVC